MKKETYVEVAPVKATKRRVVKYYCDICGKDCTDAVSRNRGTCYLCGRNACTGTLGERGCMRYDPHEPGDYPDKYCVVCYDIKYEKYGDRQSELLEKHWAEEEALDKAVKKESLNANTEEYKPQKTSKK